MKKEKSSAMGTPYTFEGRIPLKQAIPLGLQHIMAMFVGNLTPLRMRATVHFVRLFCRMQ